MQQRSFANLLPGDPAPWFHARTTANPRYALQSTAGRYIVLCFFLSAGDPQGAAAIKAAFAHWRLFNGEKLVFFGFSVDSADEKRLTDKLPGLRFFWDFDGAAGRLYGALPIDSKAGEAEVPGRRMWMVLDPTLRVMNVFPFEPDGSEREKVFKFLARLPPPEQFAGFEVHAPVLVLPNVFEPEFCRTLIDLYDKHGGGDSGFMREVNGKAVAVTDPDHKRRKDYAIDDEAIIARTRERIRRRIVPEILKVHQFKVTRMERYLVACYAVEDEAHFNAHRDNTTRGTAHRRFAVSIDLNADFDGGEISFPEYGKRGFKPPPGGAVVFSCSLLHAASKVTRGRRYAFLPFLYDEEAAKIREENNPFLSKGIEGYSSSTPTSVPPTVQ